MEVFVCGICGGSGSGKTTLTSRVVDRMGGRGVSVLAFDAYYRDLSHLPPAERDDRNYDHPDALDHELFISHLDRLHRGLDVDVPDYDFATHTRTGRFQRVPAAPLLLVEGILLLAFSEVRERLDHTVFLDVPRKVRLERRIQRDVSERGRQPDHVRWQFATTVAPMHRAYVKPHRHLAGRIAANGQPGFAVVDELADEIVGLVPAATPSRAG